MNTYFYRVLNADGEVKRGFVRLGVERDFSARLWLEKHHAGVVLSLIRTPEWLASVQDGLSQFFRQRVGRDSLSGLLRDLALMTAGGLPMLDALRVLAIDTPDNDQPEVAATAKMLLGSLDAGASVSDAFARHPDIFPETVRNLVRIGEATGSLDKVLLEAAEHVERITRIGRDVRTAMIYPVIVFVSIFAVGLFWVYYVIPNMAILFKQLHAKLPPITRGLVAFSNWLTAHLFLGVFLMVCLILVAVIVPRRVPGVKNFMYRIGHRLPIVRTLLRSAGLAYVTEHLALLIRSGVDVVSSFSILERSVHDSYYRVRVMAIRERVARGDRIGLAMQQVGGFPTMVVRMISVGEESGSLDTQLRHLATEYRQRLNTLIANLGEVLKPAMILLAGGMFIFLIVALLLPVYDLVRQSVLAPMGG
ncbi:type II secretion system F family protein [Uliginosibacterium sp. 31-16]|uniref:type II secretion system F family protein n=1 Tax=Uliginosibacterium sp. 31-16 TaxID=3068315 RepID=UPI00273DFCBF|nr:type II secretion system F family protein [Uliginosibacterium sp. 31-16]MDP5238567.1 type II secretion system F family protein [Uliginosibacterium sp. 31-16]